MLNTTPNLSLVIWLVITSGPVLAIVAERCINLIRMVGATNPKEADLGTIRGDFAIQPVEILFMLLIHQNQLKEIALFSKMMKSASISFLTRKWYTKNHKL